MDRKSGHVIETPIRAERYARIPDSVLKDAALSSSAKCIYAVLARHVYQGATVAVGQRRIAEMLGMSRSTVALGIAELVAANHVLATRKFAGGRAAYLLRSNVFGKKQGQVDEIISSPSRTPRLANVKIA